MPTQLARIAFSYSFDSKKYFNNTSNGNNNKASRKRLIFHVTLEQFIAIIFCKALHFTRQNENRKCLYRIFLLLRNSLTGKIMILLYNTSFHPCVFH